MSALREVSIPASVTAIADDAFAGCGDLVLLAESPYVIEYGLAHGMTVVVGD